jgi:hypothetical protein
MTISCVAVYLASGRDAGSSDEISRLLAAHKKEAKQAPDHLCVVGR